MVGLKMDSGYSSLPISSSAIEMQKHPDNAAAVPVVTGVDLLEDDSSGGLKGKFHDGSLDLREDLPLIVDGVAGPHGGLEESGSDIPGAVFNLATSVIGAGIMALPATMKVMGMAVGFVSVVVMGILSEVSIELLVRFSALCKSSSYGEVVQTALGRPARVVSEICILVNNAGVLIVYLIIIGDVLSGSPKHVGLLDQWVGHEGAWDHRKLLILVVLILFLAPLCALEKIDSLSLSSAASVALAVVFVVVSCGVAAVKLAEGTAETPRLGPDFGSRAALLDLLVVIPIMTNAYVCHFNVQPIYNELKGRSPERMNRVSRITSVLCVAVYAATAISGYLLFGDATESDVLTNFDKDLRIPFSSALTYIVRIGYVLHLILVFPVIHFSLRQTVGALLFSDGQSAEKGLSRKRLLGLTAVLLALIYLGSTMIPNIWVAFKFTGATTGLSLGFIFPSLIALKLDGTYGKVLTKGDKILCWSMLGLAILASIIGLIGNSYSIRSELKG